MGALGEGEMHWENENSRQSLDGKKELLCQNLMWKNPGVSRSAKKLIFIQAGPQVDSWILTIYFKWGKNCTVS